ncbi:MAG: hypothetical protein ACOYJG_13055 [Prevotella sp.]|jgi:uncharacterized protein (TIGR02145 family)
MKKILTLLVGILFISLSANAQEKVKVWLHNGTALEYYVTAVDSITFIPEDTTAASVESATVTNVQKDLAYIQVTYAGSITGATEFGINYSTSQDLSTDKQTVTSTEVEEDKIYSFNLTGLTPNTNYFYQAYVVDKDGETHYGAIQSFTTLTKYPIAEMVDLGLSVKWASWNVGASTITDYGTYIGWGDATGEMTSYTDTDYPNDYSDISGTDEDIAHVQWGDKWRMPTQAEWEELLALDKVDTTINSIKGWKITGKNGNSIFLPKGGYEISSGYQMQNQRAYYWSSENSSESYANLCTVYAVNSTFTDLNKGRHLPVRPVYGSTSGTTDTTQVVSRDLTAAGKAAQSVDLGLSVQWATYNIGATSSTEHGSYFAWGETETKSDYSKSTYKYYDSASDTFNLTDLGTDISGTDYDAATVLWGGTWRMPTEDEFQELIDNCTWTASSTGYTVTGKNGNSIFIPFAGYYNGSTLSNEDQGQYWSGSYQTNHLYTDDHYGVRLNLSATSQSISSGNYIYKGLTIRPVKE